MPSDERWQLSFTITPDVLLDASRAYQARLYAGYRIVVGLIAAAGLFVAALGDLRTGLFVFLFGAILLFLAWFRGIDRWLLRRRARGFIDRTMSYALDDAGIRYSNPVGSGLIPWSGLTSVRADARTVTLGRERVLVDYVPAKAFSSAQSRNAFIAYARAHLGSRPAS